MRQKITGSWMDFQHQNSHDGLYWNDQTRAFSCAQWEGHLADMAGAGIDTVVLMSSALDDKAFYPSAFLPARWNLTCDDPIAATLRAAAANGQQVFVSAGFYGHTTEETSDAPDYLDWHKRLTDELWTRYGQFPAFTGWYIPNEAEINGHFSAGYMEFTPRLTRHLRQISPMQKILIAPYGTRKVAETAQFVEQIQALGVDYIAYQDEVGVRKTDVEELDAIYARLHRLHEGAGIPLWADMEVFEFEGDVYASALLPARMERVARQIELLSPYIEKLLCYQYHGLMNPPETAQFCGHPDTVRLYREYAAWRQANE